MAGFFQPTVLMEEEFLNVKLTIHPTITEHSNQYTFYISTRLWSQLIRRESGTVSFGKIENLAWLNGFKFRSEFSLLSLSSNQKHDKRLRFFNLPFS
jgi:hypothetical protein